MPFTLSHPAAVLPFRRLCPQYLDFAALVIGSLAPDLGYYVRRFDVASFAHTTPGSFAVCFPSGVVLFLVFHLLCRPTCFILPAPHRETLASACPAFLPWDLRRAIAVIVSLLLRSWSHILWDSFTHETGWVVQRVPWLRDPVFMIGSTELHGYYLLQQLSTIAGGVILVAAYLTWLRRHRPPEPVPASAERWRYWLWFAIIAVALLLSLPLAADFASKFQGYLALRVFLFRAVVYFISVAIPLVILAATVAYAVRRRV